LKQELEKSYKGVLSYIQAVTNDAEGSYNAGYYWCKKFEIPADTENNSIKRGELARNTYYPKYTGGTAVVSYKLGDRTLYRTSPYMEGADVTDLQTRLNAIGFSCGTVDGKFGKNTESGVKGFQTACNLEVDGKFGKLSMAALMAYSAPQNEPEPQYMTYTVQEGDTLRSIALKYLGSADKWTELSELNDLPNIPINTVKVLKIPEQQA
jgi:peptidoglycan hydrolase-like protein with peptidoglycan-binding domain